MNNTTLAASKSATNSASELDRVMLLCALDYQDTGTPNIYKINLLTLHLATGSPA